MNYEEMNKGCFEEARRLYKTANTDQRYVLEKLFPELAESEDERIRKNCIHFLELQKSHHAATFEIDECIAWLEKQGQKEKDILEDVILDGNEDGLIAETIRYKNEKRGGQKSAYKVKIKFNIGDWITNGIDVNKIIGIDLEDENYLFENGRKSDISLVDSNSHLWTIRDAKDGDVLAGSYGTFIFMGKSNGGYCGVLSDSTFIRSTGNNEWTEDLHPATKEQRDLLFQKMNEMEYEWDNSTKKLKKIEEEHQLKEGKYYECIKSYHNLGGKYWFDEGKVYFCEKDGYLRSDPNNLIKVYDCKNWQSYFRPYTKNLAWGEENKIDKEILNAAILFAMNSTDKFACNGVSKDDVIDWLKSFKDRVQSQPKQEWSEGDSIRLQRIIDFLWYNRKGDTDAIYQQEQDIDWLKSLRPQNHWKPSEEQMEELEDVIESNCFHTLILQELLEQLKKLKEE